MKKLILLLMVCTVLLLSLSGCGEKATYSFDDPDIHAYVNGEPVYESRMNQYIDMGKLFWQAVKDLGIPEAAEDEYTDDESRQILETASEWAMEKAEAHMGLSDEEWQLAYLHTFIVRDTFYTRAKDESQMDAEDVTTKLVDTYIQEIKESGKFQYPNGRVDINAICEELSLKYDLTDDQCLDVFRDFITREFDYEYFMAYYAKHGYSGELLEYGESDTDEYIAQWRDLNAQFDTYLDTLMEKAEIVERP